MGAGPPPIRRGLFPPQKAPQPEKLRESWLPDGPSGDKIHLKTSKGACIMTCGERIKQEREKRKLSQEDLAEQMEVS